MGVNNHPLLHRSPIRSILGSARTAKGVDIGTRIEAVHDDLNEIAGLGKMSFKLENREHPFTFSPQVDEDVVATNIDHANGVLAPLLEVHGTGVCGPGGFPGLRQITERFERGHGLGHFGFNIVVKLATEFCPKQFLGGGAGAGFGGCVASCGPCTSGTYACKGF